MTTDSFIAGGNHGSYLLLEATTVRTMQHCTGRDSFSILFETGDFPVLNHHSQIMEWLVRNSVNYVGVAEYTHAGIGLRRCNTRLNEQIKTGNYFFHGRRLRSFLSLIYYDFSSFDTKIWCMQSCIAH